jgi:DNA mismatch repair protein MSH5
VGLLCATLRHFAGLPHPPRVVLCTHFSEVLQPRHLPRCPHLTFLTMSVLVEGEQQQAQQAAQAQGTEPEAEAIADGGRGDSGGGVSEPQQAGQGVAGETGGVQPVPQHLVFLYRLVGGHVAPSFGVYCAQMAGVPPAVLQRARHVIAAQASALPEAL